MEQSHQFCAPDNTVQDCLLVCLPFNGNADDHSGNDHHGTVVGAKLTTDRFGTPNSAYYFDGDNDMIEITDHPDLRLHNTDFTLSVWMMEESYNPHNNGALLVKRNLGRNNGWFLSSLGLDDGYQGNILYNVSGGGDPFCMTWSGDITLREWHHIVAVYILARQEVAIYIDGKLIKVQNGIPSPNPATTAKLLIGYDDPVKTYDFKGKIDDISIYSCALTPEQIAAHTSCSHVVGNQISVNEIFVLDNIQFESSKYDLNMTSLQELDRLATYLMKNDRLKLFIYGHTDNLGDAAANQLLSENRAAAVSQYLVQKGVNSDRIWTRGYGQSKPIADNTTDEGRAKNRRVAFLLKEVAMP